MVKSSSTLGEREVLMLLVEGKEVLDERRNVLSSSYRRSDIVIVPSTLSINLSSKIFPSSSICIELVGEIVSWLSYRDKRWWKVEQQIQVSTFKISDPQSNRKHNVNISIASTVSWILKISLVFYSSC